MKGRQGDPSLRERTSVQVVVRVWLRLARFEVTRAVVPAVVTGRRVPHSNARVVVDGELDSWANDHADHPDYQILECDFGAIQKRRKRAAH